MFKESKFAFYILMASMMLFCMWLSMPVKAIDSNQTQTTPTPLQFNYGENTQSLLFIALVLIAVIAAISVVLTVVIHRVKLG